MKKAIIDVQFNWIFIAVAGALILMFFTTIVVKQKTASEDSISGTIIVNLEPILMGARISTGTVNILDIPKKEIEFSCDEYKVGRASRGLKDKIVFAPDLIRGTQLYSWALGFNAPFKVTNFLYLTSPQVRYIIIGNGGWFTDLQQKIPSELDNFEFYGSVANIPDNNNYRVKFVYVGIPPNNNHLANLGGMNNEHVTAVKIDGSGNSGGVTFYKKSPSGGWASPGYSSQYIYLESIIAAIFSQDKETYECGMRKAFNKLNTVASIYKGRAGELAGQYTSDNNGNCRTQHHNAQSQLLTLSTLGFPSGTSSITSISVALNSMNQNAQIYSCALIY